MEKSNLQKASERADFVLRQAARDGRFLADKGWPQNTCMRLHERGLLLRDRKNAFLWSLSARGRAVVDGKATALAVSAAAGNGFAAADEVQLPETLRQDALVARVEQARHLLDAGDVNAAALLAGGAYAEAQAQASYAAKVKASRGLIEKFQRLQAEALHLESMARIRQAELVDEAQEQGRVTSRGRPKGSVAENVAGDDIFTLSDLGIDRRDLHKARELRDAERENPGIIRRVIEAQLAEGLAPTRNAMRHNVRASIGTRSATKEERGADLYETPVEAMRTLLALESFSRHVLEPSVGKGAILRPLEAAGYEVSIADLVDREIATRHGECQAVGDFLASEPLEGQPDIVTNPPYGIANAYAAHALKVHQPGKMALLLNLNFLSGYCDSDREFVLEECPPSRVYVHKHRLPMMHRDGYEGQKSSSQMNTAWFVWERNADGSYGDGHPRLIRVDWELFANSAPLAPGVPGHAILAPGAMAFKPAAPEDEFARETPRKTVEERVSEEFERAMLFIKQLEPFSLKRFRQQVAVRTQVAEALIDALLFNGLIQPCEPEEDEPQWRISAKGIAVALDVAAAVAVREWRAARDQKAQVAA